MNGPALLEIVDVLRSRHDLPLDKGRCLDLYKSKIQDIYKDLVKPVDGAGFILQELRCLGYKVMLVTSSDQDIASGFIRSQKWEPYFQGYVFGNEVKKAKPSSEIYELALKRAKVLSTSVVVVEDSCNGVRSAKATGAFVIGSINDQTKESLVGAGADITIRHLKEMMPIIEAGS